MGLLDALDYAGEHLLAPGARVIPSKIRVFAAVVELGRVGAARSLDLSPINVYRWYPHQEPLGLSSIPYR